MELRKIKSNLELHNRAGSSERRVQQSVIIVTLTAKMLFRKQRITALAKQLNQYSTVHFIDINPAATFNNVHSLCVCVCAWGVSELSVALHCCRRERIPREMGFTVSCSTLSLTHSLTAIE